jgi:HTH-type transcriptional regulator / antitoxin HigA
MATMRNHATEEAYLALVRAFPLASIRDDTHLRAALSALDRLIAQPERSVAEEVYLGALTDLVETYERAHVAIPPTSGIAALRYLMTENGLKQSDLAPLFGSPSIISEVLSGKRRLALTHMERLATYFCLPISVFLAPEPEPPALP